MAAMAVPQPPARVVVPRWVQLVLLPLAVLALYAVARAAGTVLLLFVVAAVIALILNPIVALLVRGHLPRPAAAVAVYLAFFTTLVVTGFLLADPLAEQARAFQQDVPGLIDQANGALHEVQLLFDREGIDVQVEAQGQTALETLQGRLVEGTDEIVAITGQLLRTLVEASLYLLLIIVLSVYMLVYAPSIGAIARGVMPPGDGTPQDDFPTRVQRAVYGYVRGQLLFSLIMGTSAGVALWLLGTAGIFEEGRTYALAFGAWFGLMELVPYVGPALGALPPLIVALLGDPLDALWVALLFTALQQLEGHIVAPQVFGRALRLNPLLVLFALLLGGEVYGFFGAVIALPIAAVVRETVVYLKRHLVLEPWGTSSPLVLGPRPDETAEGSETETEPLSRLRV
jgi:predicted PurR-regulated permease PerM